MNDMGAIPSIFKRAGCQCCYVVDEVDLQDWLGIRLATDESLPIGRIEIRDRGGSVLATRDMRGVVSALDIEAAKAEALREAADWMAANFTHGSGWVGDRIAALLRGRAAQVAPSRVPSEES